MKCYISGGSWIEVRPSWIGGYFEVYKFSRLYKKVWYLGLYDAKMRKERNEGPAISWNETIKKFYRRVL